MNLVPQNTELFLLDINGRKAKIGDTIVFDYEGKSIKKEINWSEVMLCVCIGPRPYHTIEKPFNFKIVSE